MKVGKFLVFAAVLALASGAGAATVNTGSIFRWDISTPVAVGDGSENLCAFTLTMVNISGDPNNNPQAFTSPDTGAPSSINTGGNDLLHNEQLPTFGINHTITPEAGVWTGWGLTPSSVDTRFLDDVANLTPIVAPSEDNIGTNAPYPSAEAGDYGGYGFRCGWSDTLSGIIALTGANANAHWDLAYVVVPSGTTVTVQTVAAGTTGTEETFDFTFGVSCIIPVPAALPLGIGGLLMAIRRRV